MNDPSLRVRVAAALAEQGIPITGWLRIGVLNGVVTLRGYFKTSRHKHLAIQILMLLNDVKETVDHTVIGEPPVEVVANSEDTWSGWLRKRWPSLTSVALLTFAGIGFAAQFRKSDGIPVYPVAGEVRVNGQIAPGAFLVFHPMTEDFPKDLRPKAQVASDGKFRVGTFDKQDGAPAGEYSVTIEWRPLIRHGDEVEPGPNVLPPFYGSPNTTTLRVRIAEKKNELRPFQVSAQPASHRNS